jgi:hypothetical protein
MVCLTVVLSARASPPTPSSSCVALPIASTVCLRCGFSMTLSPCCSSTSRSTFFSTIIGRWVAPSTGVFLSDAIGARRRVSKRVEDGSRPPALCAAHSRNGHKAVSGLAYPQGLEGLGIASPSKTIGRRRPPLAIRPCLHFFALSLAVSVKMNVLLFCPALALVLLNKTGWRRTILLISLCGLIQALLGFPFLLSNPEAYIINSFDLGRQFFYKVDSTRQELSVSDSED